MEKSVVAKFSREVLGKSVVEKCCSGVLEKSVGGDYWRRVL